MRPLSLVPVLLAATVACSDTITSPPRANEPEEEFRESVPGYLLSPRLLQSGDVVYPLVGWQTLLLNDLVGAEVLINGEIDPSDGALIIREFFVLAVDGIPAYDGMLLREDGAYSIHTYRGLDVAFQQLPPDLTVHVGKRVWLTAMNGVPIRYGVLQMR